jgi:predicted nucleotidyltransferase
MLPAAGARPERERRANASRAARMLEQAHACAALLCRAFAVREVWLFGSVAAQRVHRRSDLDLAVAGLDPRRYFEALGSLDEAATCRVDLVLIEEANETLSAAIRRDGRRLA